MLSYIYFLLFVANISKMCFKFPALSVQPSTENSSPWKAAVIVLGVLLGVALVLILLVILAYIYTKERTGKYLFEPKGLLGNFVYKHP